MMFPPDHRDFWLPAKRAADDVELDKRIEQAAEQTDTRPTEQQKQIGRYRKGRLSLHGLRIAIENPRGSTRSGVGPDGKKWKTVMKAHYGYVEGTEGKDDDPVDVFIGEHPESEYVLVINQVDPATKRFDEHKAVLGCRNYAEAKACYLSNYEKGWKGFGSAEAMTMQQFKDWLDKGDQNKQAKDKQEQEDDHPPTLAIDLDGTLAQQYDRYDPDSIPDPRPGVRRSLEQFRRDGYRIIINTVRGDDQLVRDWLEEHEIPFDHINENPDQPEGSSDKIYADLYIDDRAVAAKGKSWKQITQEVGRRVKAGEEKNYTIGPSDLHGRGVFAGRDFKKGQRIGQAVIADGKDRFDRHTLYLTELGRYLNYDRKPNIRLEGSPKSAFWLTADRDIAEGDELTASSNYHAEHKAMDLNRTTVLMNGTEKEAAEREQDDFAPGLPSREETGDIGKLRAGQLADLIIQRHLAERAGPHYDVRFGTPELGLLSWATRKQLPGPGGRVALYRQPLHTYGYRTFEGTIPKGTYGAGLVSKFVEGKILVTDVKPDQISFTMASQRYPERFKMIKSRNRKTGREYWLLINTTPTEVLPHQKVRYKSIPAEQVDEQLKKMKPGSSVSAKVDGASSLIRLLKDGIELVSYRASKPTGRPIVHTERFFGGRPRGLQIPPELVGTVLRGEIYGRKDDGRVIPPAELGGILNAVISKSLEQQRKRRVRLRNMLFDIEQLGGRAVDIEKTPYAERRRMLEDVVRQVPALQQQGFHLAEQATTPQEAQELWSRVRSGKHPLTQEGIVIHPATGKPIKAKLTEEADVYVTGAFPGAGAREATVGGLTYALEPGGRTIGRIGTGFSRAVLEDIASMPEEELRQRVARIRAQEQLPSGAYRAPAFLAFHEDYPIVKAGKEIEPVEPESACSELYDYDRYVTCIRKHRGGGRLFEQEQSEPEKTPDSADSTDSTDSAESGNAGKAPATTGATAA